MSDKVELPWADAPVWAIAAAMDQDQDWYWYGQTISHDEWIHSGDKITPTPPPAADWRKSLQLRPFSFQVRIEGQTDGCDVWLEDAAPELPEGLPQLPEGWEYVGMGKAMELGEECLYFDPGGISEWRHGEGCAQNNWQHCARRKPSAERPMVFEPGATVEPSPFLLELADRGYCFHIDEDGITAWLEDGDV